MKAHHVLATVRGGAGDSAAEEGARIQDNLYLAVNGEWAKTATIASDRPVAGGFSELDIGVEKLMLNDFAAFRAGTKTTQDPLLQEAIALNQLAFDFKTRDEQGTHPAQGLLDRLAKMNSWADINAQLPEIILDGIDKPFRLSVDPDMKNTSRHLAYFDVPGTILPDKTYYAKDHPQAPTLLAAFKDMVVKVLAKFGLSAERAGELADQTIAYDRLIAQYVKPHEELADYTKSYNPTPFSDFVAEVSNLDLAHAIPAVLGQTPETVVITEPDYFAHLNELVTPKTFPLFKSWMAVGTILSVTGQLSEDLRVLGGTYSRTLSGVAEAPSQEKHAYRVANGFFDEVIGKYYGETYFGAKAREDVRHMVQKMIAVYKNRLSTNTWLSAATRAKAVTKLDKIEIKVGYPDRLDPLYQQFKVVPTSEGGSLFSNVFHFKRLVREDNFSKIDQPVDRTRYAMPGNLVNAAYNPSFNDITFPAAILQAPFYSLKQSSSENYGGIGAVIAHEISHAFDNNGAKFDEFGNMVDWWTADDFKEFAQRTQAMIQEFDGIEYAGHSVNGKLVISENVADGGGLSCALEAAKSEPDVNLVDFFTNWAKVWQMKATQQYRELLLSIDVHAPGPLRANVQAQNLDEFYTTFKVTPDDGMWLEPAKRVHIW